MANKKRVQRRKKKKGKWKCWRCSPRSIRIHDLLCIMSRVICFYCKCFLKLMYLLAKILQQYSDTNCTNIRFSQNIDIPDSDSCSVSMLFLSLKKGHDYFVSAIYSQSFERILFLVGNEYKILMRLIRLSNHFTVRDSCKLIAPFFNAKYFLAFFCADSDRSSRGIPPSSCCLSSKSSFSKAALSSDWRTWLEYIFS